MELKWRPVEFKWSSNGAQMEPNGGQMEPNGAQKEFKWSSNGAQWSFNGASMEPGGRGRFKEGYKYMDSPPNWTPVLHNAAFELLEDYRVFFATTPEARWPGRFCYSELEENLKTYRPECS